MDPDELRDQLKAIAAHSPPGNPRARDLVIRRGRLLVRNRRIAQVVVCALSVVVLGGAVAWWNSARGPDSATVIATPTTTVSVSSTSAVTSSTTVAAPTSASNTGTTIATPTSGIITPQPGFVFVSTPVVSGNALFAIEARHDNITSTGSRVVRVDLATQRVTRTSNQSGSSALVLAGDNLWVGVGSGNGGPYGGPRITHVVGLNVDDLSPHGDVAVPAPGADGLVATSGSVWALSGSTVIRIDAATAQISSTVAPTLPTSTPFRTLAVSDDGTRLFVGWTSPTQVDGVTEFDATTGNKLNENPHVGAGPSNVGPSLVSAGSRLWVTFVTGTLAGTVALHTSDLTSTGENLSGPQSMAVAPVGPIVWVSRAVSLDCVDTRGTTLASHGTAAGIDSAAAPTARAVYVTTSAGIEIVATDSTCPGS